MIYGKYEWALALLSLSERLNERRDAYSCKILREIDHKLEREERQRERVLDERGRIKYQQNQHDRDKKTKNQKGAEVGATQGGK